MGLCYLGLTTESQSRSQPNPRRLATASAPQQSGRTNRLTADNYPADVDEAI